MSLKKIVKKNKKISDFAKSYFFRLSKIFSKLNFKKFENLEKILMKARKAKSNIFIFGNGGSAATASTMANDLGFDIIKKTKTKTPF